MYSVKFTPTALNNLTQLPKNLRQTATKAIDRLKLNPQVGTPLKRELKGFYKLRFSRYRIIYQIYKEQLLIIIFNIEHRKSVYR